MDIEEQLRIVRRSAEVALERIAMIEHKLAKTAEPEAEQWDGEGRPPSREAFIEWANRVGAVVFGPYPEFHIENVRADVNVPDNIRCTTVHHCNNHRTLNDWLEWDTDEWVPYVAPGEEADKPSKTEVGAAPSEQDEDVTPAVSVGDRVRIITREEMVARYGRGDYLRVPGGWPVEMDHLVGRTATVVGTGLWGDSATRLYLDDWSDSSGNLDWTFTSGMVEVVESEKPQPQPGEIWESKVGHLVRVTTNSFARWLNSPCAGYECYSVDQNGPYPLVRRLAHIPLGLWEDDEGDMWWADMEHEGRLICQPIPFDDDREHYAAFNLNGTQTEDENCRGRTLVRHVPTPADERFGPPPAWDESMARKEGG